MKLRITLSLALALTLSATAGAQPVRKALARVHTAAANVMSAAHDVCTRGKCQDSGVVPAGLPLPMHAPYAFEAAPPPKVAAAPAPQAVGAPRFTPIKTKLAKVRVKIIQGLVDKGVDKADAELVVGQIGDGKLIQFLIDHFDDILAIVLKLLPLFTDDGKVAIVFVGYIGPPVTLTPIVYSSGCPPPGFVLAA